MGFWFFFKDISYNLTLAGRTIRFTCTSYHKITDQMSIIGVLKNEKSDYIKITVDIQCNKYMFWKSFTNVKLQLISYWIDLTVICICEKLLALIETTFQKKARPLNWYVRHFNPILLELQDQFVKLQQQKLSTQLAQAAWLRLLYNISNYLS